MSTDAATHLPRAIREQGRTAALIVAGLALTWLVVRHSFVAYIAAISPERALLVAPQAAAALENAAEQTLMAIRARHVPHAGTLSPALLPLPTANAPAAPARAEDLQAELDRVETFARQLLEKDQLSASALRLLAEVSYFKGDARRATALMDASAQRSLRDVQAVFHWMHNSLQTGDFAAALRAADTIARAHPEFSDAAFLVLTRLAENEQARPELVRALLADPPWRDAYVSGISRYITDLRTPLHVMTALKAGGWAPRGRELTEYLTVLVDHGKHEIAHYAWLQFLTPEQLAKAGYLFNGDFASRPSGSPMDWLLKSGAGARVAILPHDKENKDHGLRVELGPGRVQFGAVMQSLILPPGSYALAGRFKGELNGRRGLLWRIACAEASEGPLAQTAMFAGSQNSWRNFEVEFVVPPANCKSQIIRLVLDARYSAEQFVTGVVWYDDLAISRR